jgi:hypothetical protein
MCQFPRLYHINFQLSFSGKNVKYQFALDFDVKYLDICVISHFFLKKRVKLI